jgi:hypothetical protein
MSPKTNCAGQLCPEREGCRRYQIRISSGKEVICDVETPTYEWASFDIERQRFGACPHLIHYRERWNA